MKSLRESGIEEREQSFRWNVIIRQRLQPESAFPILKCIANRGFCRFVECTRTEF